VGIPRLQPFLRLPHQSCKRWFHEPHLPIAMYRMKKMKTASISALCMLTLTAATVECAAEDTRSGSIDAPGTTSADHTSILKQIESGLSPPILLKGEPRPKWSMTERMAHYKVPGVSVAVIVDGKVAWSKGYGVLDSSAAQSVDTETLFQAASISKSISAAGALRLVERGTLRLDAPVNEQLKRWKIPESEYTLRRAVTLRHLLSHQAGTTVHGFPGYPRNAAVPSLIQVLKGESPANTPAVVVDTLPGESFRYSGGGTTVVQLLIEDVCNRPFAELMASEVLAPLGMTRSHFRHAIEDANAARAHAGPASEPVIGHSHVYPELAAAGLWSTPTDLAKFALAMVKALQGMEGSFLSAATARDMLTPLDEDYALGFGVVKVGDGLTFGHNGANHGYRSRLFVYADGRGGLAVMANADGGSQLIREIAGAVAAAYGWQLDAPREKEVVTLSAVEMQAIAGTYYIGSRDHGPRIQISVADSALWIEAPFWPRSRLYAASKSELYILDGQEFELETDASGRSTAILIKAGPRAPRAVDD
jgi:CubicO group peptidase (beta-lactamase class C family)